MRRVLIKLCRLMDNIQRVDIVLEMKSMPKKTDSGSMAKFATVHSEAARLERLASYQILGTNREQTFDEIANLVAYLLDAPIALITMTTADSHWFKAHIGIDVNEVPRLGSFCDHALNCDGLFCVPDSHLDARFAANPQVTGELDVRFYAGVPLIDSDGFKLGMLSVIDTKPREAITKQQEFIFKSLARIIVDRLKLRRLGTSILEAESNERIALSHAESAHKQLREIIELLPEGIIFMDAADRVILWNEQYEELFPEIASVLAPGISYEELLRTSLACGKYQECIGGDGGDAWVAKRLADYKAKRGSFEHKFNDGRYVRYDQRETSDGGTICVRVDITEVRQREESFRVLFDDNVLPMLVYDLGSLKLLAANTAAVTQYGFDKQQLREMSILDIRPLEHRAEMELNIRLQDGMATGDSDSVHLKADGGRFIATVFAKALDYQGCKAALATIIDVTERRQHEKRVEHLAHHDSLTGLPNRFMFNKYLSEILAQSAQSGASLALLLVDLDNFKIVNDSLGHAIGDALIIAVGERLKRCIRTSNFVARLGGDEFAVIQHSTDGATDSESLAKRLIAVMTLPFVIEGHRINIGASIGVTSAPQYGNDSASLLQQADLALYRAKGDGRGRFHHFEPQMQLRVLTKRALEVDLRRAMLNGELSLHYQPLVDLLTGATTGYESLLRWNHPERGMIPPSDFIPIAEDTGLIIPIGAWVLAEACQEAATWPQHLTIAVNLSAEQFKNGTAVEAVQQALLRSGLEARRLELEITETALLESSDETLVALTRLKDLGMLIVMDDFGTGYSSLSYLQKFPFGKIKIDRSFVSGLIGNPHSREIIRAILAIGASLNIRVLAEGIETQEEFNVLQQLGCLEGQGYYFGRPMPSLSIPELQKRQRAS